MKSKRMRRRSLAREQQIKRKLCLFFRLDEAKRLLFINIGSSFFVSFDCKLIISISPSHHEGDLDLFRCPQERSRQRSFSSSPV